MVGVGLLFNIFGPSPIEHGLYALSPLLQPGLELAPLPFAYILYTVLLQDLCPHFKGICPAMKNVDGGEFYKKYLLKVSFTGWV